MLSACYQRVHKSSELTAASLQRPLAPTKMVLPVSHLAILAGFLSLSAAVALNSTTPSVDLGYEIHTATTNVISTCPM